MPNYQFIDALADYLQNKYPSFPGRELLRLEHCPEGMSGDFTLNCFKFAKTCSANPIALAAEIVDFLKTLAGIENAEAVKAFVNFTVKAGTLHRATLATPDKLLNDAKLPVEKRKKILIEFSAPNTNKPQHLGHVRNNTIGMAVASLLKRVGNEVVQINLVNDRGIHICKSMIAYERWGAGATPESTGKKGDHLVGDFYVRYNRELSAEIDALRKARPELADKDSEELAPETELGKATSQMLRDWENNDPKVRALWEKMNGWVFAGFAQTYRRMGIAFDHTYLESQTYLLGKDLVADGLARNVFAKREDGAVFADLGKLGKKVVLRSDGTSVYITQDLGTTLLKYRDYRPDGMIWVVGDEQILHFQLLFTILAKLGYPWADKLEHLSYGMVNLPSGKMKSREGTVVDADDLFDEMVDLALGACRERAAGEEAVSDAELARRAEIIGMGALKFMLLKFNAKTTITFDPAAAIRFEGDTGSYVQYVCARIASIARKAAEKSITPEGADWDLLDHPSEKALSVRAGLYAEVLCTAADKRDASGLVDYLLVLAKEFNRFYRECPVLNAESPELGKARLALALSVHKLLADGLATLTIDVPEAM
ncbi:MAG: arginine--tRNA ligase [Victivallaceae bacterium]|nr:arginine--tRNA ligase [Victivallaceae bacterium]